MLPGLPGETPPVLEGKEDGGQRVLRHRNRVGLQCGGENDPALPDSRRENIADGSRSIEDGLESWRGIDEILIEHRHPIRKKSHRHAPVIRGGAASRGGIAAGR